MSDQKIIVQNQKTDMQYVACAACNGPLQVVLDKISGKFFGMCRSCRLNIPLVEKGQTSGIILVQ